MDIPFLKIKNKIISTKDISLISKVEELDRYILIIFFISEGHTEIDFETKEERDKEFDRLCDCLCKTIVPYPPVEVR